MKVLLAIDSSPASNHVISETELRPWPETTAFCILNVVDTATGATVWTDLELFVKRETEAAQKLVEEVAGRVAKRGLRASTEIANGYPAKEIADQAREWGADFIFLGSHGHSGITRFLMGSVAKAVLRDADCSVCVVRPRKDATLGAMKILLATDGSDCSTAAARSIASRRWPEETEVKVLRAVEAVLPSIEPWYGAGEIIENIYEQSLKRGDEEAQAALKIISDAGLKATRTTLVGYPKALILDEAETWGADLIVVGSHGRHGLTRLVMGSVSESVALHAHCSVEVIRERAQT